MGFDVDLPAADPPDRRGQPQGPQQHPRPPGPTTPARRGRSARKDGGHDAIHPDLGTFEDFDAFVAARQRARPRGRPRPRAAGAPDHPWVDDAPGVVHHPRRRHDRLRREPAEEVPGHLPDQLRQRPRPASAARCCGSSSYWMSHGVRIFRVDNPHTKPVAFWEWLLARGPRDRPRRALPGRGVHPAGDDAARSARSASTSPTPTSPGAPRSGRSRTTSASCPTRPTT